MDTLSKPFTTILVLLAVCFIGPLAQAKYSGGTGKPNNPYQIATAEDLMLLGETPEDYDKHFILTADIDLDPNLPGRKVFDKAVIAPDANDSEDWFQGTPFTGGFDGNGHMISHLTIRGQDYLGLFGRFDSWETAGEVKNLGVVDVSITGTGHNVGGLVGQGGAVANCNGSGVVSGNSSVGGLVGYNVGSVSDCHSTGMVSGTGWYVGGLVGRNSGSVTRCYATGSAHVAPWGEGVGGLVGNNRGDIIYCYSTGEVRGAAYALGGLVGGNYDGGQVTQCYSTGTVSGTGRYVGGLVGDNWDGTVTQCYSTGAVSSTGLYVGGLVGDTYNGSVVACLWDMQTSGQSTSADGIGKATDEMQDIQTYLEAGWDFVGEAGNGLHEAWQMPERGGYPVITVLNGYIPPELQGSGTAEDPYLIQDAIELGAVIHYSPSSHYRLAASIDLSGICWATAVIPQFAGTFDGNNLTISHLTIEGGAYLGFFGRLESGAEVRDLGVVDTNVVGLDDRVGGLVGENYGGTVIQSHSTGSISGKWDVGGLVGINVGSVIQCCSTGSVSGSSSVGGLLGYNCGTVIQSYSAGEAMGSEAVGGLIGNNDLGDITCCYSTASVAGDDAVGGLAGQNLGYVVAGVGSISECYSSGSVQGNSDVGGLVGGYDLGGYVQDCFWDVQSSGQATSSGGTGLSTAQMQDIQTYLDAGWSFSPHDIWFEPQGGGYPILWWQLSPWPALPNFSGGIGEPNDPYMISTAEQLNSIGHNSRLMECHFKLANDLDLAGCHFFVIGSSDYPYGGVFDGDGHTISHLTIEGDSYLGLFVETASGAEVRDLGVVDIGLFGSAHYVGAVVGQNGGHVIQCWSSGIVNGRHDIGGLVGKNLAGGELNGCYSIGEVNGVGTEARGGGIRAGVGGLVGTNYGIISECYSICTVSGSFLVGGLTGYNTGAVIQCYSTGPVSGQHYVGGLVGVGLASRVIACFWDIQTTGQVESAGGTGKTTAEMQTVSTFLEAGWDFVDETANGVEDIWWILEGQDYPRLWWEAAEQ